MPHEWLIGFGGVVMVVLGGSCLVYIFLRRDKTVRVYKRQGSTEASPEPRISPETVSEEEGKDETPPDAERRSWWRRLFEG